MVKTLFPFWQLKLSKNSYIGHLVDQINTRSFFNTRKSTYCPKHNQPKNTSYKYFRVKKDTNVFFTKGSGLKWGTNQAKLQKFFYFHSAPKCCTTRMHQLVRIKRERLDTPFFNGWNHRHNKGPSHTRRLALTCPHLNFSLHSPKQVVARMGNSVWSQQLNLPGATHIAHPQRRKIAFTPKWGYRSQQPKNKNWNFNVKLNLYQISVGWISRMGGYAGLRPKQPPCYLELPCWISAILEKNNRGLPRTWVPPFCVKSAGRQLLGGGWGLWHRCSWASSFNMNGDGGTLCCEHVPATVV